MPLSDVISLAFMSCTISVDQRDGKAIWWRVSQLSAIKVLGTA